MQDNKLIKILNGFDKKEMTRFKEFVYSPYFNKHDGVRKLVAYLSQIYPKFTAKFCNREFIFKTLFPNEKHDQGHLALLFTYTLRLLEQFLSEEQFKDQIHFQYILLLSALRQRKQFERYEKILQRAKKQLRQKSSLDNYFYNWGYWLANETDLYYVQIGKRLKDDSIQAMQNNLNTYYFAETLRTAVEMVIRTKILQVEYNTPMLQKVLETIESESTYYLKIPGIYIYYKLYQLVLKEEDKHYFEVFDLIKKQEESLTKVELETIFNYLQNYCIWQINKGEQTFLAQLFELYKFQLLRGLMIEEGYLSEWHYKNIVTTGIRLKETKWVRAFIEDYKKLLRPEAINNAYRFNLASYYYATKQYEKVLTLLIQVEYSDLRYNLDAKSLLLRTYYDLEEFEALFSLTDSFKQYLQRNKLMSETQRKGYFNLIRLAKKAANIKSEIPYLKIPRLEKELFKLKSELETTSSVFNKSWLFDKIQSLEEEIRNVK